MLQFDSFLATGGDASIFAAAPDWHPIDPDPSISAWEETGKKFEEASRVGDGSRKAEQMIRQSREERRGEKEQNGISFFLSACGSRFPIRVGEHQPNTSILLITISWRAHYTRRRRLPRAEQRSRFLHQSRRNYEIDRAEGGGPPNKTGPSVTSFQSMNMHVGFLSPRG